MMFDQILPTVGEVLKAHEDALKQIAPILVNVDLTGRVRLIVHERWQQAAGGEDVHASDSVRVLVQGLCDALQEHAHSPERMVLFESDLESIAKNGFAYPLQGVEGVRVIDRLATEGNWATIAPVSAGAPRVVFFSIKGGVGRSTALAATAWSLAQRGQRVLVLDLDLESPGLSSALLPPDRRPPYGIADWLVEDLVDNADAVFDDLWASSELCREGDIRVVPAHGRQPGAYISKLGRVWMPKVWPDGRRESGPERLRRLLNALEKQHQPDVVLIDSRAGIDEVASSCVTDLGATLVLLFALDGEQTWVGYRVLFEHWQRQGGARDIRERLQLVGAMIPEVDSPDYFDGLRDRGADLFADLYDEIEPGAIAEDQWNFDAHDSSAPHFPWAVRWHRGFAYLNSLHDRMISVDPNMVQMVFGSLITGIEDYLNLAGKKNG